MADKKPEGWVDFGRAKAVPFELLLDEVGVLGGLRRATCEPSCCSILSMSCMYWRLVPAAAARFEIVRVDIGSITCSKD
jgi:hypothetical protein